MCWCGTCNHSVSKLAIPGDSGVGANITCRCLGTTWGMSWDISIANSDPTGTGCKRVVGQSCRNEVSAESSKSIGQCAQGECGPGLLCVDDSTQSLQGNPYKICDRI